MNNKTGAGLSLPNSRYIFTLVRVLNAILLAKFWLNATVFYTTMDLIGPPGAGKILLARTMKYSSLLTLDYY